MDSQAHFLQVNITGMYNIAFYENGKFCTLIGGRLKTLQECINQLRVLTENTDATQTDTIVGCKWNRGGVHCCLIVINEFGTPIFATDEKKED